MTETTIIYTMTKRKGNAEMEATTTIKVCIDSRHADAFKSPTALPREHRENEEFIKLLARLQGYDTAEIKSVEVA